MTEGERTVDGKEEDNPGLDLSIHDVKKYFAMLFNRNGPTSLPAPPAPDSPHSPRPRKPLKKRSELQRKPKSWLGA